jgi:hypothetical protein
MIGPASGSSPNEKGPPVAWKPFWTRCRNRKFSSRGGSRLSDMAAQLRRVIFDTSGINKLKADIDRAAILRAMGLVFEVGLTETVISEVIATKDEVKRKAILDVLKLLLSSGAKCVMPFNWIIEEQAKAYQRDAKGYDWRRLNIRIKAAEIEVARQEFMHTLSDQTRREMKQWNRQFLKIFRDAKPAFQALFIPGKVRPSIREVTEKLMSEGGAHLEIGANLYERAVGSRPNQTQTKDFVDRCPPFRALLIALCFAQYDTCIRDEKKQSLGKAGRNDMFSAVYLPYCKVFVTADDGHCKAMRTVAELCGIECAVQTYDEFRSALVGGI